MPRLASTVVRLDDLRGYLQTYRARVHMHNERGTIYRGAATDKRTQRPMTVWIRTRPLAGNVKLEFFTGEECPCTL